MQVDRIIDNVFVIPGFFTPAECGQFIDVSEKSGYEAATIMTERGPKLMGQVRDNERLLYKDEELATMLWKRVGGRVPTFIGNSKAIGLNELFRFYKYGTGQKFKRHTDESFIRNEQEASYYTLLVYLNDDFEGGETNFDCASIKAQKGMALVFLHSLVHEGAPIRSGIKYILRTDIMYRLKDG